MMDNGTVMLESVDQTVVTIELVGDITSASEGDLLQAYQQATDQGAKLLILDFNRLEYMNSSGIGLLVTLLVRANRHGQKMAAIGLDQHYQQIFHMTRLNEAIPVYADMDEVLAAMNV